ncbi:F-box only protein 6-like [Pristis pectinata]|uniref:F-box only protein 6-like n=1 Tax=Pristis pectinata TaxID=685728 RepID=UPI00223E33DD|nr:F-box only protein 6-like [Pristis pectinata]XP_051895225.1 F-box only protein 6-like [Pristis pectinata]XP_051895226.1 F-box only protein 6-like [Pristis pectinata]XP_051895227.1 F-box only protein 6-like [Pristis pectinata]XP_051895228.1 F-box only protein 6-like [Pristis pectinata]XP_051895229.1 F-box only protein 6-like [Pristis pectinata]XP_051895230.1 F-box only protein 6-like [Pristis pectinata]
MATIGDLHEDILMVLLSYIPARELILTCRLVCRAWKELVDGVHIWKRMCLREGYFKRGWDIFPEDWMRFYFFHPLMKNLLKNPCAEEQFQFWTIDDNGGDHWNIEDLPEAHTDNFPDKGVNKYFVTSYGLCRKSQIIDLVENGLWGNLLDVIQPKIVVKDWYAARRDCGCIYRLHVSLLSEKKCIVQKYKSKVIKIPQWSDAKWNEIVHVFKDYGPGVRYVKFSHEGQDTQFWAGWYGIRVTNSSVTIEP